MISKFFWIVIVFVLFIYPFHSFAYENGWENFEERDDVYYFNINNESYGPYEKVSLALNYGDEKKSWGFKYYKNYTCDTCGGGEYYYMINGEEFGPYYSRSFTDNNILLRLHMSDNHYAFVFRSEDLNDKNYYLMLDGEIQEPCVTLTNVYISDKNYGYACFNDVDGEKDFLFVNGEKYSEDNFFRLGISKNHWGYIAYENERSKLIVNGDNLGLFDDVRDMQISDNNWAAAIENNGEYFIISNNQAMQKLALNKEQAEDYEYGVFYSLEKHGLSPQCDFCKSYGSDKIKLSDNCWTLRYSIDDKYINFNCSDIKIKNKTLYSRLKGKIVLKIEDLGKAYYINANSETMHYLGRADDAFSVMREQGVGITNENLAKFLNGNNEDNSSLKVDKIFAQKHLGKIFIQTEENGEAWYINPDDAKKYFLGRPADAFHVMRNLGLGISNDDFNSL